MAAQWEIPSPDNKGDGHHPASFSREGATDQNELGHDSQTAIQQVKYPAS